MKRKRIVKEDKCINCGNKVFIKNKTKYILCDICKKNKVIIPELEDIKNKRKKTCFEKYGCEHNSQIIDVKDKKKKNSIKKYGVENISQSEIIKNKKKQRSIEKYNCEYVLQSEDIRNKIRQTNLEKYGVENILCSAEIKEKIKQTNIEKYGVENPFQSEEIKEKIKQTNLEKYGVENIGESKEIKEKIKATNLKLYGFNTPLKNEEIKEKIKTTNLKLYGVENPQQNKEIKNKTKLTNLERYGCEYILQNKRIRDKINKTNINKYGYLNPIKNKIIKEKIKNTIFNKYKKILWDNLKYLNLELIDEYNGAQDYKTKFKCLKCLNIFKTRWFNIINQNYRCPFCYPRNPGTSLMEKDIINFISYFNIFFIKNSKDIISPKELDIFIPEKNIAIEFNGLYWHSEENINTPYYHLNKLKLCQEKNIRLIQIFEDEWLFKQDIVKARLKQILNCNNLTRIHARKCKIKEIDAKTKNLFLEKYHIQGKDSSTIKLGAFYDDEVISVMTFSKGNISKGSKTEENIWELNRFCTNYNYQIPGIASKLLSYFKRNYPWEKIFSYADLRWSEGNIYYKLGFKLEHQTTPNYWYIKRNKRIHRFNLRKKPDEPKEISERILRLKEGYYRIWDCGHLKFIMNNNVEFRIDENNLNETRIKNTQK